MAKITAKTTSAGGSQEGAGESLAPTTQDQRPAGSSEGTIPVPGPPVLPAGSAKPKTYRCRVKRSFHFEKLDRKTYGPDDGYFESLTNLMEKFGNEKFETVT